MQSVGLIFLLALGVGCEAVLEEGSPDSDTSHFPLRDLSTDLDVGDAATNTRDAGIDSDVGADLAATPTFLAGVNLATACFAPESVPGTYGVHYTYPTSDEVDYFVGKKMVVFRLSFLWERLQRSQFGAFDAAEQQRITDFVTYATGQGTYVLLDPHNYARYFGEVIGTEGVPVAAFSDFWSRLSALFIDNPLVIFGLMNEPFNMETELWRDDANAAIKAIRDAGATNLILVPGNAWPGVRACRLPLAKPDRCFAHFPAPPGPSIPRRSPGTRGE